MKTSETSLVYMEDFPRTAYEGLSSFAPGIAQL